MEILANILRPKCLNDIIGQTHLIGENKILTNLVKNKKIYSMIIYGNPGTGKNSIASAIVNELKLPYRELNAVINNKKDFDIVVEEAKLNNGMIVIMDEIHRMNKDKQDLMLPYIESGLITLIGLTTSNPYHSINPAIRSRCQIFKLNDLTIEEIEDGLKKASKHLDGIKINKKVINHIANLTGGDLRSAMTLLEVCYNADSNHNVTIDLVKTINSKPVFLMDKNGDSYYDVLSAFQKSIRGSDVNAALHYLARLILAEDLDSIYRRMTVIAYEDIGLANPGMGPKVHAAVESCKLVGLPEAQIILSSVVIELALSPKSNSGIIAMDAAMNDVKKGLSMTIPEHIHNGNPNYKYPHNYPNYWVKQQYLPDSLEGSIYYRPKKNQYEMNLQKIDQLRKK